ncbi:serine-threonine protein kinase 19 [Myxozyma melibiosi]|uniref:Serine-threonine protein kinase 19 n=1 Tax=Myxozyma melibiosi TaxID=54550 RepID=A0ABR1F9Z4_9ASCO
MWNADVEVCVDGELAQLSDIHFGINASLLQMWDAIPERGTRLNGDGIADLLRFRKTIPPIVMVSHLHALFPHNPTFIDRELQRVVEAGKIRRINVNMNAGDMVIESKYYFRILRDRKTAVAAEDESAAEIFEKFEKLLRQKPAVTAITSDFLAEFQISEEAGIRHLLNTGFLVLAGAPGVYQISVPNVGSFLKIVFRTRKWVVNLLQKTKFGEMVEKVIRERWEAGVKNRWREFRGVKFSWVMMECKGGGWCEPFETPTGRGWRLTGKRE